MPIVDLRPAKVDVRLPPSAPGLALLILAVPLLIWTGELAPLDCPRLDCASVLALAPDGATRVALTRAFPGRTVYTIHQQGDWLIAEREAGG